MHLINVAIDLFDYGGNNGGRPNAVFVARQRISSQSVPFNTIIRHFVHVKHDKIMIIVEMATK